MIPRDYFERVDTPSHNSPIGKIMRKLDPLYPEKPADELRAIAKERIHTHGGGGVNWTKDEAARLKGYVDLPVSSRVEQSEAVSRVLSLRKLKRNVSAFVATAARRDRRSGVSP